MMMSDSVVQQILEM